MRIGGRECVQHFGKFGTGFIFESGRVKRHYISRFNGTSRSAIAETMKWGKLAPGHIIGFAQKEPQNEADSR